MKFFIFFFMKKCSHVDVYILKEVVDRYPKLLLTQYFREALKRIGFKLGPEPDLSVSYFWWPTNNNNDNAFNEKLMNEIHNDGEIFLSSTLINQKFVIRMAILSFRTKLTTIDRAISMIQKILNKMNN